MSGTKLCKSLCTFDLQYKNTTCMVNNKNRFSKYKMFSGSYLIYNNTFDYQILQYILKTLHSIDGSKSDGKYVWFIN